MTRAAGNGDAPRNHPDIDTGLPMARLVKSRMEALRLTKADLVRQLGYVNTTTKGLRRLQALLEGDLRSLENLKVPLAKALAIPEALLEEASDGSRYVLWAREIQEYRRQFVPHVIWDTEFSVPRPLVIAGMIGATRRLYFNPTSREPRDWSDEAAASCPSGVPCYGRVRGFWVNYSPDCAVRFDKRGLPMEGTDHAIRPGVAKATVNGRLLRLSNASGRGW